MAKCGPRSDCSYRSGLGPCCLLLSYVRQLFAADDFSRRHFQMHFFLGAFSWVNIYTHVVIGLTTTIKSILNFLTLVF